jgi:hypothetical protein
MIEIHQAYVCCVETDIRAKWDLNSSERKVIWNNTHEAIMLMYFYMNQAEKEANLITDISVRDCVVLAIKTGIASLANGKARHVVIGLTLASVGDVLGDAVNHYWKSKNYLELARIYGKIADEQQEKLY